MDKRVIVTVVICMAILFGYQRFFGKSGEQQHATTAAAPAPTAKTEPPKTEPAKTEPPKTEPPKTEPAKTEKAKTQNADSTANNAANSETAKTPAAPIVTDTIERKGLYHAVFTTNGAAPQEWTLLDPQYKEARAIEGKKDLRQINLVKSNAPFLPTVISFPESDFALYENAQWTRSKATEDELDYELDVGSVHVEKKYTFGAGYDFQLLITVENRGEKQIAQHLQLATYGWQDPSVKPGGFLGPRTIMTSGVCDVNGKLKQHDLQSLLKEQVNELGNVRWVAVDEKYFLAAAAMPPTAPGEERKCHMQTYVAPAEGLILANVVYPERRVAPKEKTEYHFAGFFGPKILSQLDAVKVAGDDHGAPVDTKLSDAVDYGWKEMLARPMLAVLKAVDYVIPSWGFAIIVLTILIKAITWYPTTKSMKSMKAMSKLKPEMDKLKEKYGNDKTRMNQEVMELYKRHGVNPLGGCLPMLIQFPIYIALYAMLGSAVELYRSKFLWIQDLTAADPYYVLPILTGVLMFIQQKTSPQSADPQQKAMMYAMPVMFTVFSIFLPAGLTVYILTNTILTFGQQWWMNRHEPKPALKPAKA